MPISLCTGAGLSGGLRLHCPAHGASPLSGSQGATKDGRGLSWPGLDKHGCGDDTLTRMWKCHVQQALHSKAGMQLGPWVSRSQPLWGPEAAE